MTLRRVADGAAIVACNNCSGGAALIAQLRALRDADPAYAGIAVQEMACLFACREACAIHLRAPGRIGYVLGRFDPDAAAARAILDYAARYAESAAGEVAYDAWPEGVKGHFIARMPPPGYLID